MSRNELKKEEEFRALMSTLSVAMRPAQAARLSRNSHINLIVLRYQLSPYQQFPGMRLQSREHFGRPEGLGLQPAPRRLVLPLLLGMAGDSTCCAYRPRPRAPPPATLLPASPNTCPSHFRSSQLLARSERPKGWGRTASFPMRPLSSLAGAPEELCIWDFLRAKQASDTQPQPFPFASVQQLQIVCARNRRWGGGFFVCPMQRFPASLPRHVGVQ